MNIQRSAVGKPLLIENLDLYKAAQRHAEDCAKHGLTGHIGSDGSTLANRVEDSGYLLWVDQSLYTVYTTEKVQAGPNLTAGGFIGSWLEEVPELLTDIYTEISVGYFIDGAGFQVIVGVAGGVENRWPGAAPFDTTNLDEYFFANAEFTGDNVGLKEPRVFAV